MTGIQQETKETNKIIAEVLVLTNHFINRWFSANKKQLKIYQKLFGMLKKKLSQRTTLAICASAE